MREADASITNMALNGASGRFDDQGVYAEFFYHARRNDAKSLEEGREIYDDVPYVKIMVPGDKDNIVMRPIRDSDKRRFPRQYEAFMTNADQPTEGTPLEEWAGISRSMVEELKPFGIRTMEQLVEMPDSHAQKFMGINALRAKARAWIDDAKGKAPIEALQRENEALKAQMQELIDELRALKAESEKPTRRTRRKVDGAVQDGE